MSSSLRVRSSLALGLLAGIALCIADGSRAFAAPRHPAQDLGYNYGYVLRYPPAPAPQAVLRMATTNVSAYFPFQGCGTVLHVGQVCSLQGPNGNNPIKVVAIGPTSFSFLSLPGHAEGAGRTIVFSFIVQTSPINTQRLFLDVHASGPWSAGAAASVASGLARGFWQQYATNLQRGIASGAAR